MNNQMVQEKKFKCFTCGQEIKFMGSRVRYNLNGTVHVCNQEQKQQYKQAGGYKQEKTYGKSRYNSYWAWYWGFGPGKYHKDNEKRYSNETYEQRRKAAEEQRRKWRQEYTNTESNYSELQALEILELGAEVLKLAIKEKIQAIKAAYRKLALKFHPDRKPDGNAQRFIEIQSAYEMLTN